MSGWRVSAEPEAERRVLLEHFDIDIAPHCFHSVPYDKVRHHSTKHRSPAPRPNGRGDRGLPDDTIGKPGHELDQVCLAARAGLFEQLSQVEPHSGLRDAQRFSDVWYAADLDHG
jgi:hypothetical protein